jgi:hypothetical protein
MTVDCLLTNRFASVASLKEEKDRKCSQTIPSGDSGYCECEDGKRAQEVGCEHEPFRCKDECRKLFGEAPSAGGEAAEKSAGEAAANGGKHEEL